MNRTNQLRLKGIAMAVSAAALWGIQGNVVDYLFRTTDMTLDWIIITRLFFSGVILLLFLYMTKQRKSIFTIWRNKRDSFTLLAFAVFGLLGLQYSFFAAIKHSNAATAAILQYLAPSLLLIFACFKAKRYPVKKELLALVLTFIGLFLLVTNGDITKLSISGMALFWGVVSAFALCYYTLQPMKLIQRYSSTVITMWSMLIGSVALSLKTNPLKTGVSFSISEWVLVILVVVMTFVSFYLYLASLSFITSAEAGLLTVIEPLTAVFVSVLIMGIMIGNVSLMGGLLILAVVMMMGKSSAENDKQAFKQKTG
ncbi:EamA family transporter [Pueribacillus theae]|uniref:EamA family transporter n=1 Tax=Pueribacillus theae TaxID=2171751 RepID=A0A2U1JU10_9BACI|nr:DMT family transporter [Pueribacillus theae]PWA08434.1 EamA family transporter [Pueribacillus theae]